jgi:DNA-binding PadR family transcriptional regulator
MVAIGSTKEKILKEIGKGPIHGYELADRLGISLTFIYQHLKDLRKGGFVESREEGRKKVYTLTSKGRHMLKALE